jgi:hypothetical protein
VTHQGNSCEGLQVSGIGCRTKDPGGDPTEGLVPKIREGRTEDPSANEGRGLDL